MKNDMPEEIWAKSTDMDLYGVVDNFGSYIAKKVDGCTRYVRADLAEPVCNGCAHGCPKCCSYLRKDNTKMVNIPYADGSPSREYILEDANAPQPPTDNDHVAEGCEKFAKPTSRPLAEIIKELEAAGFKTALDKAREEVKGLFKPVIDDGLREACDRCEHDMRVSGTVNPNDLETLINHALKSQDKPVDTQSIINTLRHAEIQNCGSDKDGVGASLKQALRLLNGIKIIDGGA